jgi:hypothetical protein
MSAKKHVLRLGGLVPALAAGACLMLAGCGGGGSPAAASGGGAAGGSGNSAPASAGSVGGGSDSAACTAFAAAYKKFLAGYAPPESQTGTDETPLQALSDAITKISAAGQSEQDLANLGIDAGLIATGSSEGGITTPPSAFYTDLQAVAKDCGTTFTRAPASLVREG